MQDKTIGFIGGGNMATSLIGGLVAMGHDPQRILVADPSPAQREKLASTLGVMVFSDNAELTAQADVLLMAVKPNVMLAVLAELAPIIQVRRPLVITIAAGLPMRSYSALLGQDVPLVRAMPNTPALVRAGMTGAVLNDPSDTAAKKLATAVLEAVGEVRWLDTDAELDGLTAVSGSGPAYFFYMMECMQASAQALGMSPELARDLVLHTAYGAAKLALHDPASAAELRARVTSPGGTTAKGIEALQNGKLPEVVDNAIQAARQRAEDMSRDA
jgi:pyrroline-5-carboxylate reductase